MATAQLFRIEMGKHFNPALELQYIAVIRGVFAVNMRLPTLKNSQSGPVMLR